MMRITSRFGMLVQHRRRIEGLLLSTTSLDRARNLVPISTSAIYIDMYTYG